MSKINVEKQQHATPKELGQELSPSVAGYRHLSPSIVGHHRPPASTIAARQRSPPIIIGHAGRVGKVVAGMGGQPSRRAAARHAGCWAEGRSVGRVLFPTPRKAGVGKQNAVGGDSRWSTSNLNAPNLPWKNAFSATGYTAVNRQAPCNLLFLVLKEGPLLRNSSHLRQTLARQVRFPR